MKNILVASLLVSGFLVAGVSTASAHPIRDCVIEMAGDELSEGQAALVAAHGNGQADHLSTIQDNDLNLADIIRVHGFLWVATTACVVEG